MYLSNINDIIVFLLSGGGILLIALIIGAIVLICYLVAKAHYEKSDYYQLTHKSYSEMKNDLGSYGEYLTYDKLRHYESQGAKFLFNVYLPKDNGETTEIDLMMVHPKGIVVFESKNYSGWIFGEEEQTYWTQTLPKGRKASKEKFYNPIMQNKGHIKWLKNIIGEEIPVKSVIVFSDRCTMKHVAFSGSEVRVIHRYDVLETVEYLLSTMPGVIPQASFDSLYKTLYPYTQATDELKVKHVSTIKMQQNDIPPIMGNANELICPKCGGTLQLRVAKRGANAGNQFYGCSNYPKCKYVRNISG